MPGRKLTQWFRRNARELPWREQPRDPYRVLVSELMLQQTQVDRVIPKFEEFMIRFPTLVELAAATEDEVLEVWSGLGYYRRARLLHRLARTVSDDPSGLPRTAAELERLPGVGPYTAAAVASLAFGEAVPVLDGNVMRVASRVTRFEGDPRSPAGRLELAAWVGSLFVDAAAAVVNEGLMELGATVCLPSTPRCDRCPLAAECGARDEGVPGKYPRPRARRPVIDLRWVAACAIDPKGRWLVRQVDRGPILRGLWLPPIAEVAESDDPAAVARRLVPLPVASSPTIMSPVKHGITHRRIEVIPVRLEVTSSDGTGRSERWIEPGLPAIPTSSLLSKLLQNNML